MQIKFKKKKQKQKQKQNKTKQKTLLSHFLTNLRIYSTNIK